MKGLLHLFGALPRSVKILLLLSTARSVSFFALLPFLPIYLHDHLHLAMDQIGYALGVCLLIGTLTSVYGGYLADRLDKVKLILALDVGLTILYLALPAVGTPVLVLGLLALANTASSTMSVTGNALLAELLPPELRTKAFSLRYSLQNIGAVTGPFLGAWAAGSSSKGPFWIAAGVTLLALLLLASSRRHFARAPSPPGDAPLAFSETLTAMRSDRRLGLFTIGGILSMVVYGPLLTYMSQFLVAVESPAVAYRTVAYLSAANAIVVITSQYFIGSRLRDETLLRWLTWGIGAFALGLIGLSLSTALVPCVIAIVVFSIGEVIVVPAEYTFLDSIAPSHLRGSYFGVQNLIHLGIAFSPALCGVLLDRLVPAAMFYTLAGVALVSWLFYFLGCRAAGAFAARGPGPLRPEQQP